MVIYSHLQQVRYLLFIALPQSPIYKDLNNPTGCMFQYTILNSILIKNTVKLFHIYCKQTFTEVCVRLGGLSWFLITFYLDVWECFSPLRFWHITNMQGARRWDGLHKRSPPQTLWHVWKWFYGYDRFLTVKPKCFFFFTFEFCHLWFKW